MRGGRGEVPTVGRHAVDSAHRLDRAGSGAGAAAGGGIGGQVCAGEGHHAADLSIGRRLLSQGAHGRSSKAAQHLTIACSRQGKPETLGLGDKLHEIG